MRKTGIEWSGEIPNEWEFYRLKEVVSIQNGKEIEVELDEGIPVYGSGGIFKYTDGYLYEGKSVLLGRKGTIDNPQYVEGKFWTIDTSYYTIVNEEKLLTKLFYYMCQCFDYKYFQTGSTLPSMTQLDLGSIKLPIADSFEQKIIVDFLDNKVAKIDKVIYLLKQEIEKLEEYKKSIITEVVTSGLINGKENWQIKRLKYCFSTNKGLSITKENLQPEGIPVISYGQIHSKYGVRVNPEEDDLPFVDSDYLKKKSTLLEYGDFIFADTSEDIIGSGNFSTNFGKCNFFAGYHTIIVKLKDFHDHDFRYFMYLFDSEWFRKNIQSRVSGVKVYSITQQILKNAEIIIPPIEEQKLMADYLESKVPVLEKSIKLLRLEIEKQKEIKKTLIFEYVTGKHRLIK